MREKILEDAKNAVCKDREISHGNAKQQMTHTAELWMAYLNENSCEEMIITAKDVAMLNILQKISRSCFNASHEHHYTDIAGYAALAGELA
jgi:Domain of unknown function (DUF6378)